MWSCIKAITISAALITLEPLLISPRSFAQYLKLEDEAAKTCTVKLQATPWGSTHATGICKETAYSFIHFLYPLCAGAWSCPGELAGYSPDKWPVHHRVTETTIHTHIHTQGQFRAASYPNFHVWTVGGCQSTGRTLSDTGRTCKLKHTERPQTREPKSDLPAVRLQLCWYAFVS